MEALGGSMQRFGLAISGSARDAILGHPRIDYGVAPVAAREPVLIARAGPSDSRCTSACQRAADTVGSEAQADPRFSRRRRRRGAARSRMPSPPRWRRRRHRCCPERRRLNPLPARPCRRSARNWASSGLRQVRDDDVADLELGGRQRLAIDEVHDRTQQQIDEYDETRRHRCVEQVAPSGQHADGGGAPERGGGVEPAHVQAFAEDQSGAEEADSRHRPGRRPGSGWRLLERPPRK